MAPPAADAEAQWTTLLTQDGASIDGGAITAPEERHASAAVHVVSSACMQRR